MCSSSIRRYLLFHLFGNNYTVLSLTKWISFELIFVQPMESISPNKHHPNYPLIHHMGLYYIGFASFMYQNPSQEEHHFPHHVPLKCFISAVPICLKSQYAVHWKAHILVESRENSLISSYLLVNFTIFFIILVGHVLRSVQLADFVLRPGMFTPGACLSSNVSRWLFGTRAILGMSALAVVAGKIDDSTITIPI